VEVLDASTSPPKESYAVSDDNAFKLNQPEAFDDQLTEILRQGARTLLAQAVEAEVADFLAKHIGLKTEDGCQRIVRHGHLPEREVMTGIGPVAVRQPRVRDREAAAGDPGRIRFSPAILPRYMRRSKSIETLLPIPMHCGPGPYWWKKPLKELPATFNTRAESVATKPMFRDAPASGYCEWLKRPDRKQLYFISAADGGVLSLAGPPGSMERS
jgi:hypothetical protein